MKTLFIFPLILFAFLSANDDGEDIECCPKKIVGGKTYIYDGKAEQKEVAQALDTVSKSYHISIGHSQVEDFEWTHPSREGGPLSESYWILYLRVSNF